MVISVNPAHIAAFIFQRTRNREKYCQFSRSHGRISIASIHSLIAVFIVGRRALRVKCTTVMRITIDCTWTWHQRDTLMQWSLASWAHKLWMRVCSQLSDWSIDGWENWIYCFVNYRVPLNGLVVVYSFECSRLFLIWFMHFKRGPVGVADALHFTQIEWR